MEGILFGALASCISTLAAGSIEWQPVHPQPGLPALSGVAFGHDRFVASGVGGIYFSEDAGGTWHPGFSYPTMRYNAVAFAEGQFVAVGDSNQVAVSQDGQNWTAHDIPATGNLQTVVNTGGLWLAGGDNGLIASSPDARTWTATNVFAGVQIGMIAHGNGVFLAVGGRLDNNSANIFTSSDAVHWKALRIPIPGVDPNCVPSTFPFPVYCENFRGLHGLAFFEGRFVMLGWHPADIASNFRTKALVSTNGTDWSVDDGEVARASFPPPSEPQRNSLALANGRLFDLYDRAVSTNAIEHWEPLALYPPYLVYEFSAPVRFFSGIAYGQSNYLLVGAYNNKWALVARSTNLTSFERLHSPRLGYGPRKIASRGPTLVAIQPVLVSTNSGFSFRTANLPAGAQMPVAIHSAQEKFVAVGKGGTILRSADGTTWSKRLSNTSADLNDIAFGNGLWVAVGLNGAIAHSPDASFFTLASPNTDIALNAVTFGNGNFVAVGNSGAILRSANGQDWTIYGTDAAEDLLAVAYGNGRFLATGNNGTVHTSKDGSGWTTRKIAGAATLSSAAFGSGNFLVVDDSGTAFLSTNGLDWTPVSFSATPRSADSSEGSLWVLGDDEFIAKGVPSPPMQQLTIQAIRSAGHGERVLNFAPSTGGDYEILFAPNLQSAWVPAIRFTNVTQRVTWTNELPQQATEFYMVRQVSPSPGR